MEKVLVIEDNDQVRQNIVEILKIDNYEISEARNGKEALQKIDGENYELIVSDIMMPQMDGYELVRVLREEKKLDVPFIFLTAKAEMHDLRHGMNEGADDYISKPFRAEDLLKSVQLRIGRARMQKEHLKELGNNIALFMPHEVRSPLLPIRGYSQLIESEIDNLSKEEIMALVKDIDSSGSRLESTLDKFMRYSELQLITPEKAAKLQKEKFNYPQNLLKKLIAGFTKKAGRSADIDISVDNIPLRISEGHLKIISEELIENSLKFSNSGDKICIKTNVLEESVQLIFQNRGPGISAENIRKIGLFMQFDRKSENKAGNGLGLSIVKSILKIYNGKISITSTQNVLTTIIVTLNRAEKLKKG